VGLSDPAGYCRDLVRKHDYESFLVGQFYPQAKQDAYFAIKAFSVSVLLASASGRGRTDGVLHSDPFH